MATCSDCDHYTDEIVHQLREVVKAKAALDLAVQQARRHGISWQAIGHLYGVTRQAAQARFGRESTEDVAS